MMKVKSKVEFIIHVDNYKNVDILTFQEGFYHLRFIIYVVFNNTKQVILAQPTNIVDLDKSRQKYIVKNKLNTNLNGEQQDTQKRKNKAKSIIVPHIFNEYHAYCTKTFLIRSFFDDEIVGINEICTFELDLEDYPLPSDAQIMIDCELMYAQLPDDNSEIQTSLQTNQIQFNCVSLYKAEINKENIKSGISEYVPIIFDEDHFNLAGLTLHSCITDFCQASGHHDQTNSLSNQKLIKQNRLQQQTKHYMQPFDSQIDQFHTLKQNSNDELMKFYETYISLLRDQYLVTCSNIKAIKKYYDETVTCKDIVYQSLFEKYFPDDLPPSCVRYKSMQNAYSANTPAEKEFIYQGEKLIENIVKELNQLNKLNVAVWYKFQQMFLVNSSQITKILRKRYNKFNKQLWEDFICSRTVMVDNHSIFTNTQQIQQNEIDSKLVRQRALTKENAHYNSVKDIRILSDKMQNPVIFNDIFQLKSKDYDDIRIFKKTTFHLFVFVHGFQGNAFDMRLIKNHMMLLYPECLFLLSIQNEGRTEGNIQVMGENLAKEITDFVKKWCPGKQLGKISFVAHSLGGVIVRACLPLLKEDFQDKMFTFLSFGVPHLGYMHSKHSLINIGLWFLKTWRGSVCLNQLEMKDHKDLRQTYLYNLSKQEGLEWFRNVVFCSSTQDHYVPVESARVEKLQEQGGQSIQVYNEMVDNLLSNLKNDIQRLDINFEISEKGLDTFIGRKAHILFLELQSLMRMIIHNFDHLFI
ncbi:hypothetical protein ABPG74_005612 [Tetrahymena malaccensis]